LKIQNKWNFKLIIKVSQKHIRLNLWKEVFDALREPVKVMKDEGAIVKATFIYKEGYSIHDGVVTYDILDAMTQPEEEWKANAVTFFDAVRSPSIFVCIQLTKRVSNPMFPISTVCTGMRIAQISIPTVRCISPKKKSTTARNQLWIRSCTLTDVTHLRPIIFCASTWELGL